MNPAALRRIDAGEFGVTLADDSPDRLEQTIVELSGRPAEWVRARSLETRRVAEQEYGEAAFVARWRAILDEVLADAPGRYGRSEAGSRRASRERRIYSGDHSARRRT